MKVSRENSLIIREKITQAQKGLDEIASLVETLTDDLTDIERHNLKSVNKTKGWLSNLKSDVKRAGNQP